MKIHKLKLKSKFCRMKRLDAKRWEMRRNDRDFQVGDFVMYVEVADSEVSDSGRPVKDGWTKLYRIDSILTHDDFYEIPPGFVIWSESEADLNPAAMRRALMELAK